MAPILEALTKGGAFTMGYFIRVLSQSDAVVPVGGIRQELAADLPVDLSASGPEDAWEQLHLTHPDGTPIASVQRIEAAPGAPGEAEIREFIEEVSVCKPTSAADWLQRYLTTVKAI